MTDSRRAVSSVARPKHSQDWVDRTDRSILRILRRDGRRSNAAVAEGVGIAASTCLERTRRLRAAGILRGFHANIDFAALGLPLQALVAVRLKVHERDQINSFQALAPHLPGVLEIFHIAGYNDFLLHVVAASTDALRDAVLDITAQVLVEHVETNLIFDHVVGVEPL